MSQVHRGSVKWFNNAKGFGFIEHESGQDVFVHYSVIQTDGFKTLKDGEEVEYELAEGTKGLHAKIVTRINQPKKSAPQSIASQIEVEVEKAPSTEAQQEAPANQPAQQQTTESNAPATER